MSTSYKTENFPHETVTPILGKPTYSTLSDLKEQIMTNAESVPNPLGGGLYGHLGLVTSPAEYKIITPGNPFIYPIHPGPLAFPPKTQLVISLQFNLICCCISPLLQYNSASKNASKL